jgi:two-component system sensor histidine kinase BaeS
VRGDRPTPDDLAPGIGGGPDEEPWQRWTRAETRWRDGWSGGLEGGPPWRRAGRRRGPAHAARAIGCGLLFVVVVVGGIAALATWIAASVLGVVAPSAAPSLVTATAVLIVIAVALLVAIRVVVLSVPPLADIAEATRRLADGEPGVRVRVRGLRPVRSLGTSFNTMAERLDRSRHQRQELLADVTHELRTPLTVVQGGLEAMLDGVHPMDEDHVAPILAETETMGRLLDDLRTLSLADAGALTLHREPADLAAIVREAMAAQQPIAAARRVQLGASGESRLVATVDPVRFREIVANLLANAIRHTPPGGRVDARLDAWDGTAELVVHDTGEGIQVADLGRVFDRYHRRADTGGTGLGLAIVRDLSEAHGGTVMAESEGVPGRGSTFRVRLPLDRD